MQVAVPPSFSALAPTMQNVGDDDVFHKGASDNQSIETNKSTTRGFPPDLAMAFSTKNHRPSALSLSTSDNTILRRIGGRTSVSTPGMDKEVNLMFGGVDKYMTQLKNGESASTPGLPKHLHSYSLLTPTIGTIQTFTFPPSSEEALIKDIEETFQKLESVLVPPQPGLIFEPIFYNVEAINALFLAWAKPGCRLDVIDLIKHTELFGQFSQLPSAKEKCFKEMPTAGTVVLAPYKNDDGVDEWFRGLVVRAGDDKDQCEVLYSDFLKFKPSVRCCADTPTSGSGSCQDRQKEGKRKNEGNAGGSPPKKTAEDVSPNVVLDMHNVGKLLPDFVLHFTKDKQGGLRIRCSGCNVGSYVDGLVVDKEHLYKCAEVINHILQDAGPMDDEWDDDDVMGERVYHGERGVDWGRIRTLCFHGCQPEYTDTAENLLEFVRRHSVHLRTDWNTIDSDPGVLTELIRDFGVTGMEVEELSMLDESLFERLRPVHALIVRYVLKLRYIKTTSSVSSDTSICFGAQTDRSVSATQAIVNILLNVQHDDLKLGEMLTSFKEFSQGFDPMLRGQCLSNCEMIRSVHNSFARNELFETFGRKAEKEEDIFHFVGYLPISGRLVELDGLAEGPIDHGEIPEGKDWLYIATPIIENRMNTYSGKEIRFTLLSLITDRKMVYSKQLAELQAQYESMPTDVISQQIAQLNGLMQDEVEKDRLSKVENIRRKHNFLPFIVELFRVFAESGNLKSLYDEAAKKGKSGNEGRSD